MADQGFGFEGDQSPNVIQDDELPSYGYAASPPPPVQSTNTLAIVSLVLGILGLLACFCMGGFAIILGIPAAITGFIAHNQINQSGGTQKGREMALIGLILGIVEVVLGIILLVALGGMMGLSLLQEGF